MFKFVHAADLHLDSPFQGLSDDAPEIRRLLYDATFLAMNNLIDLCIDENVDFLLIAGDLYDSKDRSLRAQLRLRRGLTKLADAGIASYIAHGNHDPLNGWQASIELPNLVHVFDDRIGSVIHSRSGEPIAIVHGISYNRPDIKENLSLKFERRDSPLFQIGLLHCNVGDKTGHEPYSPCSIADLVAAGLDYWALGHVHKGGVLREHSPCIIYAGNTQGRHVNESGPRGCYIVNVDDAHGVRTEFHAIDALRWHSIAQSIDKIANPDGLLNAIQGSLHRIQADASGRPSVCRLTLTGRGPMHSDLSMMNRAEEYFSEIREFGMSLSPIVWVSDMRLETKWEIDLGRRMASNDVVGDCLRLIDQYCRDGIERARLSECLDELLLHRSAGRYIDRFDDKTLIRLLESAQSILLNELLGAED
ncbi:MAG: DNA repair exonuclease [Candidatus Coatesbacteria bacterium]|nr:DNA repair exonuclease [Candidatus Coatesbacteria bacterium]